MCPTNRWKSWRSRCRSIDVEHTSPAALAAEPSARHCRWSHEFLADKSGGRQQWQTHSGCSELSFIVVAVVISYLRPSLFTRFNTACMRVVKSATAEYFLTVNGQNYLECRIAVDLHVLNETNFASVRRVRQVQAK